MLPARTAYYVLINSPRDSEKLNEIGIALIRDGKENLCI